MDRLLTSIAHDFKLYWYFHVTVKLYMAYSLKFDEDAAVNISEYNYTSERTTDEAGSSHIRHTLCTS